LAAIACRLYANDKQVSGYGAEHSAYAQYGAPECSSRYQQQYARYQLNAAGAYASPGLYAQFRKYRHRFGVRSKFKVQRLQQDQCRKSAQYPGYDVFDVHRYAVF